MSRLIRVAAMIAALIIPHRLGAGASSQTDGRDDIVRLPAGEAEMAAAVRNARMALDAFLKVSDNPPPGTSDFSLKVGLPLNEVDVEYVWVRPFKRNGADFTGRLVNAPRDFPGLKIGQQIGFDRANVIDFAYRDGAVLKGHFTTCVLLKRMPAAQREAILAENPIACARPSG